MKLKVLYISYDGATDPLGQSQIVPYLEKLSKRGVSFILLTFDKKESFKNAKMVERTKDILSKSSIKWKSLNYHKVPSVFATSYDSLRGILTGWFLIRRYNIDIVCARSYVAALIAFGLKKITRCKFIFDMRGFWPEERIDGGLWKKGCLLYKIAKLLEKKFILNANQVVVLTKKAKEIMEKYYLNSIKRPIEVIPTCADLDRFNPEAKRDDILNGINLKDKFVFIYSGSIGTWYGLNEMIDFFKVARAKINNAYFIFLTPFEKKSIESQMQIEGFSKDDFIVESLSYDKVPGWLSIADASIFFIKPSFSKTGSCPTKFAESLACGVPVIINSGIGDCDEFVEKGKVGVIIREFSLDNYAHAIDVLQKLLENRGLKERCQHVAKEYFSLDKGIEKYQQIYQSLINRKDK